MQDRPTAPDFKLTDQAGTERTLEGYRGKWLILYVYPKDGTPICTAAACGFRDEYQTLVESVQAAVVGISQDSPESHAAFAAANNLPFTLLSDSDLAVTKAYDCYQPETTPDREYLGIMRSTFLIDPTGRIAKTYRGVVPEGHVAEIIRDLRQLQSSPA